MKYARFNGGVKVSSGYYGLVPFAGTAQKRKRLKKPMTRPNFQKKVGQ